MTAVPPSRMQFAQEWLEGTQKIAKVVTMSQSYSLTADVPKKKIHSAEAAVHRTSTGPHLWPKGSKLVVRYKGEHEYLC